MARTNREEAKPPTIKCLSATCDRAATRSDSFCARHSALRLTIAEYKLEVRERIERNADKYASMHLSGARIAAAEGDTRPAEWALERAGIVKPPPKESADVGGIVVNVGIALPGLGLDK